MKLQRFAKLETDLLRKGQSEAAIQSCSYETVFREYAANLQENTHVEVSFH